jgi:hypothetical protein
MLTLLKPSFAHRHNPDGSLDSICTKCYQTVETAIEEEDLAGVERSHDCEELARSKHADLGKKARTSQRGR